MKHPMTVIAALAAAALLAGPVLAGTQKPTHASSSHRAPCAKVREALAGGKSIDQVAKEMKLAPATVRQCQSTARSSH